MRTRAACGSLAIARDGKTLLAGSSHGAITQWDVASGALLPASADPVGWFQSVRFVAGGKRLLAMTDRLTAYDWKTGRAAQRYNDTPSIHPLGFGSAVSDDGALLATPLDDHKSIAIFDVRAGKRLRTVPGAQKRIVQTLFSADKRTLFWSGGGTVHAWDLAAGKERYAVKAGSALLLSPDGRWLAMRPDPYYGGRAEVAVWEAATGRLMCRIAPPWRSLDALAFAPTSTMLIGAGSVRVNPREGDQGEVAFFDVRTGAATKTLPRFAHGLMRLAVSPDGRTLAIHTSLDPLRLWEIATGHERHRYAGQPAPVLDFSPDGALLAAASNDGPLLVWDIYGKHRHRAAAAKGFAGATRQLWQELCGQDAHAGFLAVRRLVQHRAAAVALVRERMKPAAPIDAERFGQRLAELDSADFAVRQTAFAELEQLGDAIEGRLRKALAGQRTLEAKRRIEALLAKGTAATPEHLGRWRALEALEQIATPDALRLLDALAAGEPSARLTCDAAAACARLQKRAVR